MIEAIRKQVQPLYDNKDLLGFTVIDDDGELVHNESFLCDQSACESASIFLNCRSNMLDSKRKVKRLIIELDDISLIYCLTPAGHTVYTLDHDCDLDAAAKILIPS